MLCHVVWKGGNLAIDWIKSSRRKSSRAAIGRDIALPDSFHSFFSFPASKGGYSGVAVYTDTRTATLLKAEEGLSGGLQPKIPSSPSERISTSYPLRTNSTLITGWFIQAGIRKSAHVKQIMARVLIILITSGGPGGARAQLAWAECKHAS